MKCDSLENRECRRAFVYIFCDHDPSSICVPLTYLLASFTQVLARFTFCYAIELFRERNKMGEAMRLLASLDGKSWRILFSEVFSLVPPPLLASVFHCFWIRLAIFMDAARTSVASRNRIFSGDPLVVAICTLLSVCGADWNYIRWGLDWTSCTSWKECGGG